MMGCSGLREGWGTLSLSDNSYPGLLREIAAPPAVLYYRGDPAALERPAICIVGSRAASRRGLLAAARLGYELSRRDIMVVSGMARGIDGAAHRGALKGGGGTCAVLGCGLDVLYPPEHGGLAADIERHGCIVTEYPLGTLPLRHHFPLRNRILSGLSLGVVIVEADSSSGAMRTARWAIEQNREVFAVPGPVEHSGSRGPHRLIREGAVLVESVDDILAELPPCGRIVAPLEDAAAEVSLTGQERAVLSALGLDPKHIDEIIQICNISATSLLPLLLDLEIRGFVESCGGGTYALPTDRGGI